jgi:hypothetical protein
MLRNPHARQAFQLDRRTIVESHNGSIEQCAKYPWPGGFEFPLEFRFLFPFVLGNHRQFENDRTVQKIRTRDDISDGLPHFMAVGVPFLNGTEFCE